MALPTEISSPSPSVEPSESSIAVRLEHVEKRFGDVLAVDNVDLDVHDGEFFSMLGPSGSGKTTTLRMIAGFEQPTSGRVVLHGRDVTGVPPFERDVNTVFQDYALFPHMTVGDNVGYGLMVRKVDKASRRTRVAEALRMVRLDGLRGAQAEPAVGRTAPARRPRSRPRQPASRAPPRRAARRPRPQAPRGHADRAQADPATGRDHLHLRHPRSGRGADDERPPGGVQQREDRTARERRPRSTSGPRHRSWPGLSGPPTC